MGAEGKGEMSSLQLVALALVVAAALAGGFTYFVTPPTRVEDDRQLPPTAPHVTGPSAATPKVIGQRRSAEDFQRAVEAILKRLPDAQASARTDELPITGHIPLPKRHPIPR
jgi:hypothetical protein